MRILHVLTWVGPGNPFGGPSTVATNQAEALRHRGHDVVVIAAQPSGRRRGAWTADRLGVRAFDAFRILPAGFSGVVSPRMIWWAARNLRRFDVVHVHLARDLVTLPIAALALMRRVPYVLQPHGMVDRSPKRSARVLDWMSTRRVLRSARRVLVLTSDEMAEVLAVGGTSDMSMTLLPNGVPSLLVGNAKIQQPTEVLFCSRLHSRKRPVLFADMAMSLLDAGSQASFVLVGPDEGDGDAVSERITRVGDASLLRWEGGIEPYEVLQRLSRCDLLVLPSALEPFPMVVLEALALGKAVVVTEQCGLAPFIREHRCGMVIAVDELAALAKAVRYLIEHPDERRAMGESGRAAVECHLSISSVAEALEGHYREAVSPSFS